MSKLLVEARGLLAWTLATSDVVAAMPGARRTRAGSALLAQVLDFALLLGEVAGASDPARAALLGELVRFSLERDEEAAWAELRVGEASRTGIRRCARAGEEAQLKRLLEACARDYAAWSVGDFRDVARSVVVEASLPASRRTLAAAAPEVSSFAGRVRGLASELATGATSLEALAVTLGGAPAVRGR